MEVIINRLRDMLLSWLEGILTDTFEVLSGGLVGVPDIARLSPTEWEGGLPWQMTESIARTVMVPVAAIILTYVMAMEIITVVMDKNNFHEVDVTMIYKIVFKMMIAVVVVNHSLELVGGMFQLGAYLIAQSSAVISGLTPEPAQNASIIIEELRNNSDVDPGAISNLIVSSMVCYLIAWVIKIVAYLTVYSRLIEIVIYSSVCPIPMATFMNKSWSGIGQNYLKSLLALAVQGFLILFILGIYSVMLQNASFDFSTPDSLRNDLWMRCILGVVLCMTLLKSGSITKSIFNAH